MRVAFGDYQLDTKTRSLKREGRRIRIQSKAFDLLTYLIEHRDQVVSSDELLDALWPGLHVTPAALSTAVQKARQAVGDDGGHQAVIHTEHGKGFRFVAEVTDLSGPEKVRSEATGATQLPFIAELKRRNVFRVAVAYGIVAWLLVEIASVVLPTFDAPEWVMQAFTFLVILGFPLALIFAWAYELTPEGIKRESAVDPAESITHLTRRKLDFAIIGLLALAVVFLFVDHYVLEDEVVQPTRTVARGKSIAVLPFANMSADPDQEYFADGISEELLNTLVRFEDLHVVGRTSSFSFRDSDADLKQIGEKLGVNVILEGSVRRAGDRVRITAQLVDAEDGFHRWSETYDRELTDIFAIQTEIATAIADALRLNLSAKERKQLTTPPTQNLEAYQAYLLGKRRLAEQTMSAVVAAIGYFERAIDLDPKFALAYVGLADSFLLEGPATADMTARARAAVNQALELDDQLGEAQAALGYFRLMDNDFAGAEAAFQRAATLAPHSSRVYRDHASLLRDRGRFEEMLALAQKAVELDPLSVVAIQRVGSALVALGRFDEGLAWHERALEINPGHAEPYFSVASYHWMVTGRLDEAMVWLRRSLAIDPNPAWLAILGWLYLELGGFDEAEHWISRAYEMASESYYPNAAMQELALDRGDDAAVVVHGTKAYEIWPQELLALTFLRDRDVRSARYAEARTRYAQQYPELFEDEDPRVNHHNYMHAVDLALILARTGDPEQAELLRERSLQLLRSVPRLGWAGYEIIDAQVHAQRAEKEKALSAIRQAIEEGWRVGWWRWFRHKPDLESLHDEPEYQAMVAEIEADMAAQLARVRGMERNGELEPILEIPTTTH
ncbi:MAG: winged helix-turn-helix domain-containing protein [Deltaproteobacteria bacterium]|jgi:TolB-like protein/DNA-binding winged helix-turn-helix (wHTH) protein/Tfp pilus assembly protein PilF|nr:winged helix-turn-helix domain-containing protein [Deltaproteobacteria bacterium]